MTNIHLQLGIVFDDVDVIACKGVLIKLLPSLVISCKRLVIDRVILVGTAEILIINFL